MFLRWSSTYFEVLVSIEKSNMATTTKTCLTLLTNTFPLELILHMKNKSYTNDTTVDQLQTFVLGEFHDGCLNETTYIN